MKNKIFLFVLIFGSLTSFAQTQYNDEYKQSLDSIKKSKIFKDYCLDYNVEENIKISVKYNMLCDMFLPKEINTDCILEHCHNELLVFNHSKNRNFRKMNDKGRKKILVKFTNVVCGYFITTVEYIGNHRKWLGFVFKIKDGELLLVQTHIYTIDI